MFIGMAPGMDEAIEGRYFCGASGQRLTKDCVSAGINLDRARIQNVYQYWPREHDPKTLTDDQRTAGREALRADILAVRPEVIVPLGNEALEFLTGLTGITNWRGSVLNLTDFDPSLPPALVIPTLHPSAVLREFDFQVLVLKDLEKVSKALRGDDVSPPRRKLVTKYDPDYLATIDYITQQARNGTRLACDIEVVAGTVSCISFAESPTLSLSICGSDREAWLAILETDCPKIWHNSMYDLTFLEAREGVKPNGKQHDTMFLWHALYPELACSAAVGKSLGVLTSLFTNENYYKFQLRKSLNEVDWKLHYEYNARDSAVTVEIFDTLWEKVVQAGLTHVYDFELSLVEPYKNASIRGLRIDTKTKGIKASTTKKSLNDLEDRLVEMVGSGFNPRSPVQVLKAAKKFGVVLKSTSKEAFTDLLLKGKMTDEGKRFVDLMMEHRELQKAYGTYYTFEHDSDGRVRTSWTIPGTETGRMANSKSIIFEGGCNLMTIPRPARQFFIADEGYTLVYADLSQAEARIVAAVSGCEGLLEAFDTKDAYKMIAAWMFNKPVEEIDYDERYLAKRCVLGLLYGMGPKTWRTQVNIDKGFDYISLKRATELYNLFFATFPEVKDYHGWVERHVRRNRSIHTLGPEPRRRIFRPRDGMFSDHQFREAYDYPPQGTVPWIVNKAVLELESYPENIQLLAQIHDAYFGQVRSGGEMAKYLKLVRQAMIRPIETKNIRGEDITITIPVELQIGQNWMEDSDDNPNGLRKYIDA